MRSHPVPKPITCKGGGGGQVEENSTRADPKGLPGAAGKGEEAKVTTLVAAPTYK